jgi:hypothetical protein
MEGRIALHRFLQAFPDYALTQRSNGGRGRFRGYSTLGAKLVADL